MSINCGECDTLISPKQFSSSIKCTGPCSLWYHSKCAQVSEVELLIYKADDKKGDGKKWLCNKCTIPSYSMIKDLIHTELTVIKDEFSTIGQTMSKILETMSSLVTRVSNLEAENAVLKKEIAVLRNAPATEDLLEELSNREKRQRNLIFYNMPEVSTQTVFNGSKDDGESFQMIMQFLKIECKPISFYRLSSQPGRNRPLKVTLSDRGQVLSILRCKRRLGDSVDFRNISIATDLTPRQRTELKSVKADLKQRTENGEEDLFLKFVNGRPIISKNSSNKRKATSPVVHNSKK